MVRPRKDGLASVRKPRLYETYRLPVGKGRFVVVRMPLGGLSQAEAEMVSDYIGMLAQPAGDPLQGSLGDPLQGSLLEDL